MRSNDSVSTVVQHSFLYCRCCVSTNFGFEEVSESISGEDTHIHHLLCSKVCEETLEGLSYKNRFTSFLWSVEID